MISCCVFLLTVFVNMTAAITSLCFRYCIYLIKQTDTLHSILCLVSCIASWRLSTCIQYIPFLYFKLDYIPVLLFCSNLTTQTASSTMRHVLFLSFILLILVLVVVCSFVQSFIHSFVRIGRGLSAGMMRTLVVVVVVVVVVVYSFVHSFICSFIRSSVRSFVHSFVRSYGGLSFPQFSFYEKGTVQCMMRRTLVTCKAT